MRENIDTSTPSRLGQRLADTVTGHGSAYRMGGDEFCTLWHLDSIDHALDRATEVTTALTEHGEAFTIDCSHGSVLLPTETTDPTDALRLADQRLYLNKASGRVSAQRQSQQVLKRVLEQRDQLLGIHLDDVARLVQQTALALGLDEAEVEQAVMAAELHDIGKSAIPDAILFKPGPLDDEEFAFIKRHTIIGERILSGAPSLSAVARVVRSTHERVDGNGYPDGLAGDAIPLAARIVFVCDAFDAMTSDRPYSTPKTAESAVAELRACGGTQFDAAVVEAFAHALRRRPARI